jgi:hypothetical protein
MRGRVSIDCGCGGPGSGLSWLLVIRNAAVAFLALMAAASVSSRELDVADFVVMILGVVTALVVLLGVEQAGGNGAYVWRERHRSR